MQLNNEEVEMRLEELDQRYVELDSQTKLFHAAMMRFAANVTESDEYKNGLFASADHVASPYIARNRAAYARANTHLQRARYALWRVQDESTELRRACLAAGWRWEPYPDAKRAKLN